MDDRARHSRQGSAFSSVGGLSRGPRESIGPAMEEIHKFAHDEMVRDGVHATFNRRRPDSPGQDDFSLPRRSPTVTLRNGNASNNKNSSR